MEEQNTATTSAPVQPIVIQLDGSWSGELKLNAKCPECGKRMIADNRAGSTDSWNEAPDLCVVTVACEACDGTGSIHLCLTEV